MEKQLATTTDSGIVALADKIEKAVAEAKQRLAGSVNSIMVTTYWLVGKYIVEDEQEGNVNAQYGKATLTALS